MVFTLKTDYITLQQLLKACSLADSGGQARMILEDGEVKVNGETETRRGRKLRKGDTVLYGKETISIQ